MNDSILLVPLPSHSIVISFGLMIDNLPVSEAPVEPTPEPTCPNIVRFALRFGKLPTEQATEYDDK